MLPYGGLDSRREGGRRDPAEGTKPERRRRRRKLPAIIMAGWLLQPPPGAFVVVVMRRRRRKTCWDISALPEAKLQLRHPHSPIFGKGKRNKALGKRERRRLKMATAAFVTFANPCVALATEVLSVRPNIN